jgi:polyvinyl alcohol dehydrogenase (cytochrome)
MNMRRPMRALILALTFNVIARTSVLAVVPAPPDAQPQNLDSLRDKMDASKPAVDREQLPGAAVYREHCQICHEGQAPKAPSRTFLQMMTPEAIDRALTVGIMQRQAAALSTDDKEHVAEYLSGLPFGAPEPPTAPRCAGAAARFDLAHKPDIVGWGFDPENTNFIGARAAKLPVSDIPRLAVKWTFAYPASARARSRPTFAYGALYVGSQTGIVYALDAKTGCIRWTFSTSAEVRTPIVIPATGGGAKRAYFGDILGRVYAVDALTGKELWRDRADDHPSATITGAPVYFKGTVYVGVSSLEEATVDPTYACCTFRGSVVAFDAATGKRRWQRYTIDEAPRESGVTHSGTKIFAPSGRHLEHAHGGCEARLTLCRHRQQLHRSGQRPQQFRARARLEVRTHRVGLAGRRRRCVERRLYDRTRKLPREFRPRLRHWLERRPRQARERRGAIVRGAEERYGARPRSGPSDACRMVAARWTRHHPRRNPVWHGLRRHTPLRPDLGHG